jgi:hypothetical protein
MRRRRGERRRLHSLRSRRKLPPRRLRRLVRFVLPGYADWRRVLCWLPRCCGNGRHRMRLPVDRTGRKGRTRCGV